MVRTFSQNTLIAGLDVEEEEVGVDMLMRFSLGAGGSAALAWPARP